MLKVEGILISQSLYCDVVVIEIELLGNLRVIGLLSRISTTQFKLLSETKRARSSSRGRSPRPFRPKFNLIFTTSLSSFHFNWLRYKGRTGYSFTFVRFSSCSPLYHTSKTNSICSVKSCCRVELGLGLESSALHHIVPKCPISNWAGYTNRTSHVMYLFLL